MKSVETLLKRVTLSTEWKERMLMTMSIIFMNSSFLDKKLMSLKFLKEIIRLVQANKFEKMNNDELVKNYLN